MILVRPRDRLWLLSIALALTLLLLLLLLPSQRSNTPNFSDTTDHDHRPLARRTDIGSKGLTKSSPILAFLILGTQGKENKRMLRLLQAIYHPRNRYLLYLDSSSTRKERMELALLIHSQDIFQEFDNVDVVGKTYAVNQMGASGLAAVLHAAAVLLKISTDWDWFIPLSTSDYPLLTQDDILYAFTSLPRDMNFVGYTNDTIHLKNRKQNLSEIAVDPSLYLAKNERLFYAAETREKPDAFRVFGGSRWMILSRGLMEHCVNGWDNLPRKLLMYFNNVAYPLESYFHTILCNTPEFRNTTVIVKKDDDDCYKHHNEHNTNIAMFGGAFEENDPALREIDENVLNRAADRVVAGKWCKKRNDTQDFCSVGEDIDGVEEGHRGIELQKSLSRAIQGSKSGACDHILRHT